jgi:hypothetical protein
MIVLILVFQEYFAREINTLQSTEEEGKCFGVTPKLQSVHKNFKKST